MKRNKNIEALRALLICYMVFYHYMLTVLGTELYVRNEVAVFIESFGQFALIGFFVISGFGTYLSFEKKDKLLFREYIMKRMKAMLPQYYLCIGSVLLLTTGLGYLNRENLKYVLESLLLVQNYDVNNSVNGATWTLAVLFQLYFISIPLYKLIKKHGNYVWIITMLFSVLLKRAAFYYIGKYNLDSIFYVAASVRVPFTTLDLIAVGMCAAKIAIQLKEYTKGKRCIPILAIILIPVYHVLFLEFAIKVGAIFSNNMISCVWRSVIGGIIAVICFLLYQCTCSYKSWWGKFVQFIAKYEYGIYLWHMVIMGNFMIFQPDWFAELMQVSPVACAFIVFAITIFVGYISSELVNKNRNK